MKKFLTSAVLLSAILVSCNEKKAAEQLPAEVATFKVAYINMDSILSNYALAKEMNEVLIRKQEDARLSINQQAKKLQDEMAVFQKKVENNAFLSRERAEAEAKSLQKKEADLQALDQRLTQEILNEQQKMSLEVRQNIDSVVKNYSSENGLQMVLSTSSLQSSVIYALDGLDISQEIIARLNEKK